MPAIRLESSEVDSGRSGLPPVVRAIPNRPVRARVTGFVEELSDPPPARVVDLDRDRGSMREPELERGHALEWIWCGGREVGMRRSRSRRDAHDLRGCEECEP